MSEALHSFGELIAAARPSAVTGQHVANQLRGVVLKDNAEDGKKFRAYVEHAAKPRAESDPAWRAFHEAARKQSLG